MIGSFWPPTLLAVAMLLLLGHALLLMLIRETTLYWFERWALAFLIGSAAGCGLWIAFSPFYSVVPAVWLLSLVIVVIAAAGRKGVGRPDPFSAQAMKVGSLEWLLGAVLAIQFGVLLLASLHAPLGWDGLFNFEMKARLAFENIPAGRLPLAYYSDLSRAWSHPRYPLLIPFSELWIYSWLGRVDQSAIKVVFPLFFFSLTALVCGFVWRVSGDRRVAMLCGVALGLLPQLTLLPGATSGYAEVPLAAAVVGAVSFGWLALASDNGEALSLSGILLIIAVWIKSEGLMLACSVAVCALGCLLWKRQRSSAPTFLAMRVMWVLAVPVLATALWLLFQSRYAVTSGDFLPVTFHTLSENASRAPAILQLAAVEMLRPGHWGAIWLAWGAAALLAIRRRRDLRVTDLFVFGAVALPMGLYAIVFVFSAWEDVAEHAGWALPRLLVPLAPVALAFVVQQVRADLASRSVAT